MTLATGVFKQVKFKAESAYGTAPPASGAQLLRRVSFDPRLIKDTYQSAEVVTHQQVSDFRHGVRRVEATLRGELAPGSYKDFMAAAVRRAFSSVTAMTGLSITIAGSGPTYTLTRGAGSYLADGLKVGDVVRLTAGGFASGNLNKNLMVTALTATVATVIVLNGSSLTAEGPVSSATLTVVGKKTYVPASGHLDTSFTFEDWHADISQSELYLGCKVDTMALSLPPTGIARVDFGFKGKDLVTSSSEYFTSPTAAPTTGVLAAVNGALLVNGSRVATVTGLDINLAGNLAGEPVVGSNTIPQQFPGRVVVTGSFSAYFEDGTFRDYFINEDEVALAVALTANNAPDADFLAFVLPRVKLGSAAKTDGEQQITRSYDFTALFNGAGGSGTASEQSTLVIQDSKA